MSVPNWPKLGDGMFRVVHDLLKPRAAERLTKLVSQVLCDYAAAGLQLQRTRTTGPTDEELRELSCAAAAPFLSRVRRIVRQGARCEDLRCVGSTRDPIVSRLRQSSFIQNFPHLRDAILESLLDRHCSGWRQHESISIDEVPILCYEHMLSDLKKGLIEPGLIRYGCACCLSDVLFRCNQLVFVSVRSDMETDLSLDGIMGKLNALLASDNPGLIRDAVQTAAMLNDLFANAQADRSCEDDNTKESDEIADGVADTGATVHGWLSGALVTPPAPWARLYSRLQEHFPHVNLPSEHREPSGWHRLCENSHYLIVSSVAAGLGEASPLIQRKLRRMNALARCFRREASGGRHTSLEFGALWWGWEASSRARCRLLAVPTSEPAVFTERKSWSCVAPDANWRERQETDEFSLAGYPFVTQEDFASLAEGDFLKAWRWISASETKAAEELRRAIECFETAMSLGGARGNIAPELEEGWSLSAMITSLEAIFGDRQAVVDAVHQLMMRRGLAPVQAYKCRALVHRAYDARNSLVHAGDADFDAGIAGELSLVVAGVLREEITRRMAAERL